MLTPYYQDDWCVIYNADCYEVLPHLPKADLVLTDPPYAMDMSGGGSYKKSLQYIQAIKGKLDSGFDLSVLEYGRNWLCFCSRLQLVSLITMAASNGRWMLLTWHKTNPVPLTSHTYLPDTEYAVHRFGNGDDLHGGYEQRARYYISPTEQSSFAHPTVKPLPLMERIVQVASARDQLILDPFMGSGTTLVAAKQLGRRAIGIEIERKYCDIAIERLRQQPLPLYEAPAQPAENLVLFD